MNLSLVADPRFSNHVTPYGHPERPDRIKALLDALLRPPIRDFSRIEPSPCDPAWVEKVHSRRHIENIRATSDRTLTQLDGDTFASAESYRTALLAAGGCVDLVERLLDGSTDAGMALVRPPGHHAESGRAMGFCLFNNVAVAAARALASPGVGKVAILDYDVHHGNGTQEIFYRRPEVLYVSLHQHPLYPGTGGFSETGAGEGIGATLNFPIPPGMGNDFYLALLDDLAIPALRRHAPDLLLVSAGFDAHRDDPLAQMTLDADGFRSIAQRLNAAARQLCGGKILYVLEGGYHLGALTDSVLATIDACLEKDPAAPEPVAPPAGYRIYREEAVRRLGSR